MSGWGMGWFGGGGQKGKEAPKNAILQLRSTQDMLMKREKHLQLQMDEQDAVARKNVGGNKNVAKQALRRKKQFESQLEKTSAQMMTIEQQISSIETANINKETLDAMKNAGSAMKKIHGGLTIDKVDQTMEDLRDQHAVAEEISDALTQGAAASGIDEEDLNAELDDLEQEAMDNKMLETGTAPVSDRVQRLPTAAQGEIGGKTHAEEEDEEEELRKLQAEMAM